MTDSEIVPRGKGEKEPWARSEKEHETVIWQAVGEVWPWPRACGRMSRRLIGGGLVKDYNPKPKRKQVWSVHLVCLERFRHSLWTRTRVIYSWPGWSLGNTKWRSELIDVEKSWDELWLGVKHFCPTKRWLFVIYWLITVKPKGARVNQDVLTVRVIIRFMQQPKAIPWEV